MLCLLMLLSRVSLAQNSDKDSDGNAAVLDMNARREIIAYLDACREKSLNNKEDAAKKFLEVLTINPNNAAAKYELARIMDEKRAYDKALDLVNEALKGDPENTYYLDFKAELLTKQSNNKEAVKVYEKILKLRPRDVEVLYKIADTYILMQKYEDAIGYYDKVEAILGVDEEMSLQKEKLWLQLNRVDKAEKEITKLIENFPAEVRYYNILAELYHANNLHDKAFEVYKQIEKISPDEAFLNMQMAEYYRSKGNKEQSFVYLKKAFANRNLDIDTKMKVLMSFYTLSETNAAMKGQAYELLEILEDTHGTDPKAYAVYGDFLYRDNKLPEAKLKYQKCLDLDKAKYPVWSQYLVILSQLRDNDLLIKTATEAIELFPVEAFSYLLKGLSQIQTKQYQDAITTLIKGKSLSFDKNMQGQFWSSLGDVYNETKETAKSDSSYIEALKIEPNNANVLNNFSYYLSVRKKDLEKAKEMSKKSNDLEPDNASYQDTYGWILFQMGNYTEAKVWIEKAIANGGQTNGTLIEHLGDVEAQLGNTSKATELWQQAKGLGDTSTQLDKKLKEKKYSE